MNDKQQDESLSYSWQLSQEDDMDIRQAYPLMDEVARQEGWDDPEMDSYNIHARRHESAT